MTSASWPGLPNANPTMADALAVAPWVPGGARSSDRSGQQHGQEKNVKGPVPTGPFEGRPQLDAPNFLSDCRIGRRTART